MKKIILLLGFITVVMGTKAQDIKEIFDGWNEVYFSFTGESRAELDKISSIISLDDIDGKTVFAYANEKEFDKFLSLGKDFTILQHPSTLLEPKMRSEVDLKGVNDWDYYPTYDAYISMMNQFQANHPDICQVYSIGQTVDGRELMVARISDNVNDLEAEPQVLYTSTMHGDETTGYVLALRLIDYFLNNYGSDPRITDMVNNMDIYINPLANPDGAYAGGNSSIWNATRYNGNGIDLNRNYPDPVGGDHPDGNAWQPETVAFMDFAENHDFVLSSNWHGGAEVYNFPWDYKYELHPDDDWWYYTGRTWADTVHLNANSGYFTELDNGVTNGAAWYVIDGGRQDYMNYFQHCREVTVELSGTKTPPESDLPYYWEAQYRSMLTYLEQANYGIKGLVTDAGTGNPVEAKVMINNHDEDESWVYSTALHGDYYRPIKAGTYSVTFSAPCYESQTFTGINVQDLQATILNVQLVSTGFAADFEATNTNVQLGAEVNFDPIACGSPTSYEWTFEGGTPSTSTEISPTVVYNTAGTFDVSLTISDGTNTETLTKEDYITASAIYYIENGSITTCTGMFYDTGGDTDDYGNNEDFTMTIYPGSANAMLQVVFSSFEVEDNETCQYDYLIIYDGENASATEIGTYCGENSPGTVIATNSTGALTFVFHSDYSVSKAGWEASISCSGGAPSANFSADDVSILPGGEVQFSDLSTNNPTSWSWTFAGGTPASSTEQNPTVTYADSGDFTVSLTATNAEGSNTITMENYINVDLSNGVELISNEKVVLFPNPTSGLLKIQSNAKVNLVEVVNQNGQILIQKDINTKSLNLRELENGIYFIRIYTESTLVTRKISLLK